MLQRMMPADPGVFHHTVQIGPQIRGQRVTLKQVLRVHREMRIGPPHHHIGALSLSNGSSQLRHAQQLRRRATHPAADVPHIKPAPSRFGPHAGQAQLQRRYAAPSVFKIARLGKLQAGHTRAVVGHHLINGAIGQAGPERFSVVRAANRGCALELCGPVRDVFRNQTDSADRSPP